MVNVAVKTEIAEIAKERSALLAFRRFFDELRDCGAFIDEPSARPENTALRIVGIFVHEQGSDFLRSKFEKVRSNKVAQGFFGHAGKRCAHFNEYIAEIE